MFTWSSMFLYSRTYFILFESHCYILYIKKQTSNSIIATVHLYLNLSMSTKKKFGLFRNSIRAPKLVQLNQLWKQCYWRQLVVVAYSIVKWLHSIPSSADLAWADDAMKIMQPFRKWHSRVISLRFAAMCQEINCAMYQFEEHKNKKRSYSRYQYRFIYNEASKCIWRITPECFELSKS